MHRARAEGNILQHLYFFFDDSGILHATNSVGYFVYAGFVFTSRNQLDNAKRKYKSLLIKIKKELQCTDELKAAALGKKHRRALYNVLRSQEYMKEYYARESQFVDTKTIFLKCWSKRKSSV